MLYATPLITIYTLVTTTVFGLCMGSFLNCMAWRMTHGESVLKGRSHCATCNHVLAGKDLIPVVSWLALKGRCRYCGEKVSVRYLLVELFTAVIFVATVCFFDLSFNALEMLILASILICLSLTDLDDCTIPNALIIAGIVNRLVFACLSGDILGSLLASAIGGFAVVIPLLLIVLIADKLLGKETMGGGDLKLFFMVGLYMTWQEDILTVILSCIFGIVFSLISMKGKVFGGKVFPFGPSIATAALVVLFVGDSLLSWYLGLF